MGADVVIGAEGLGKKYLIGHQVANERNVTLRDVIAGTARGFARSMRDALGCRQWLKSKNPEFERA
jgi:lipopolysaccharide transport system ATP-binding protein